MTDYYKKKKNATNEMEQIIKNLTKIGHKAKKKELLTQLALKHGLSRALETHLERLKYLNLVIEEIENNEKVLKWNFGKQL